MGMGWWCMITFGALPVRSSWNSRRMIFTSALKSFIWDFWRSYTISDINLVLWDGWLPALCSGSPRPSRCWRRVFGGSSPEPEWSDWPVSKLIYISMRSWSIASIVEHIYVRTFRTRPNRSILTAHFNKLSLSHRITRKRTLVSEEKFCGLIALKRRRIGLQFRFCHHVRSELANVMDCVTFRGSRRTYFGDCFLQRS